MTGGTNMKRHSTETLMRLTKKELVEYVRMAEHNQEVAEEALEQQAINIKELLKKYEEKLKTKN